MELPFIDKIERAADKIKDNTGIRLEEWPVFIAALILLVVSYIFMPNVVKFAASAALFLLPVWFPFLVLSGAVALWVILKRGEFLDSTKYVLLEIKLPRNIVKTPLAMEAFLSTLHISGGESNWFLVWIKGSVRPFWSLEIASFGGQVHFYIWTRVMFRKVVESQLYAQYPGVQLVEVPDYTMSMNLEPDTFGTGIWGCDFKHTAEDPLPIKTYVEYGLDKIQKEPEQTDPLSNLIEYMSSINKDEYLWLQFVIRFHKGEKYHKKYGKGYTWKNEAEELVKKIRALTRETYIDPITGQERPGFPSPTKGQAEKIAAIERNVSKQAFDVGIRGVYLTKGKFSVVTVLHMIALFKPFSTEGWNGINSSGWMKRFDDYPWEVGTKYYENLKNKHRRNMVEAYRRRQFFYEPFSFGINKDDIMVMSTEEIATLFHIPSSTVASPSLGRIQSSTGEAPANLPT